MAYPVPWALNEDTSFVEELENYHDALRAARISR